MRTTEPARWQELLDKVASITPATLEKYYAQKRFEFIGHQVKFGTPEQKARFSTVEGLNTQLDEFSTRVGLVYYIDESIMGLAKAAFEKTREEQYG